MKQFCVSGYWSNPVSVDDCDWDRVNQHKWYYNKGNNSISTIFYDDKGNSKGGITLARFILNLVDPSFEVDHKDRNIFNNTRNNLRIATSSQNSANKSPQRGKRYKGTYYSVRKNRTSSWTAKIQQNYKQISLGNFKTEEEAAKAYDEAAKRIHGEFAYLNFPEKE